MNTEIKRFGDFAKETILDGDKVSLDSIVNKEVEFLAFRIAESKFKERNYITIQIKSDNKKHIIFTGSEVLSDQLKRYENELPFFATIRKINKYYSLT